MFWREADETATVIPAETVLAVGASSFCRKLGPRFRGEDGGRGKLGLRYGRKLRRDDERDLSHLPKLPLQLLRGSHRLPTRVATAHVGSGLPIPAGAFGQQGNLRGRHLGIPCISGRLNR